MLACSSHFNGLSALLAHCWARLCAVDLEVKAFHCQAMTGMCSVTWQECGTADTYFCVFSDTYVGTDAQTIWAPRNVIKHDLLFKNSVLRLFKSELAGWAALLLVNAGTHFDTRPWDWVASWERSLVLGSIKGTCTAGPQQYCAFGTPIAHCKHLWDRLGINKFSRFKL